MTNSFNYSNGNIRQPLIWLGIFSLACLWFGCQNDGKEATQLPTAQPQPTETMNVPTDSLPLPKQDNAAAVQGTEPADMGKFIKQKLACGTVLNIPEKGMEAALVSFIEDKNRPVGEGTWFEFDRLAFQADKGSLDVRKSFEQLNNLLQILKCYPSVTLTVAGPNADPKLPTDWANTMKATLIGLGVEPARILVGGQGAYPARLAVKVTAK